MPKAEAIPQRLACGEINLRDLNEDNKTGNFSGATALALS